MASPETLHSFMVTSPPLDASYDESDGEKSSPLATVVVVPSLDTNNEVTTKDEVSQPLLDKRSSTRASFMADVSRRLSRRKILHNRLSIISDIMCVFGLLGVVLMILENELSFIDIYHEQSMVSFAIKTIISITTIIIIGLVFYYNRVSLSLYAVNNYLDNWRVGLTANRTFFIFLELVICLIHPFPRNFPFIQTIKPINSTITQPLSLTHIDTDVALGLPMFGRLYLLCRFMMYHSHLVQDASSQSLGYLNQVSINFSFLIKTYLEQWPTRCLFTFSIFLLFIGSWSLRACNYTSTAEHLSMLDSMWLFTVTFTTVGYGDLTPSTYCGRFIAGMIGLFGILSTALIISVLAQKLVLSRSEKYVHNFVLNIELAKQRRHQAANVVKCALRVWYLRRKGHPTSSQYTKAQRRLFRSIHFNQQLKQEQRSLIDNCIGFPELITVQREVNGKTKENTKKSIIMKAKIDEIEEKLIDMNQTMISIQNTLNLLLHKMSQ